MSAWRSSSPGTSATAKDVAPAAQPAAAQGSKPTGSRVSCPPCGVEFRVGRSDQLDHLIAAVQQHASGSHGHAPTREHILAELLPA